MSLMYRWLYRVRQFRRALRARPCPDGLRALDCYLSPNERSLFDRVSPRDQFHQLETLRLLSRAAAPSRPLARAALLHDAGKGSVRLHDRVLYVVLAAAAPAVLERLTRHEGRGPLGALYRIRHHARIGADRVRALGAEPRVVELIARHHDPPGDDAELRALIAADDEA